MSFSLFPIRSPATDRSPCERSPFAGWSLVFGCRRVLMLSQGSCGLSPSFLSYKTCRSHCGSPGWRSMARRDSPPVPTLHDGLGKVSAALAAPRTGPGRQVLGSIGVGEECSWCGMKLCRSFCWTWTQPRDGSPVPATLPHGQQSERLPEPLAMPLLHGLQQRTVVGGRFPRGASPAETGELSSTHLLQRWTPESSR